MHERIEALQEQLDKTRTEASRITLYKRMVAHAQRRVREEREARLAAEKRVAALEAEILTLRGLAG